MTIKIQLINGKKFQNLHNPIINSVKETKDNSLALIVTVQQIAGTAGGLTAPDNSPTAENGDSLSPTFYSSPNGPDPRHVVPAHVSHRQRIYIPPQTNHPNNHRYSKVHLGITVISHRETTIKSRHLSTINFSCKNSLSRAKLP